MQVIQHHNARSASASVFSTSKGCASRWGGHRRPQEATGQFGSNGSWENAFFCDGFKPPLKKKHVGWISSICAAPPCQSVAPNLKFKPLLLDHRVGWIPTMPGSPVLQISVNGVTILFLTKVFTKSFFCFQKAQCPLKLKHGRLRLAQQRQRDQVWF